MSFAAPCLHCLSSCHPVPPGRTGLPLQRQLSSQLSKPHSLGLSSSAMGSSHSGNFCWTRVALVLFTGVLPYLSAGLWILCNTQHVQGLTETFPNTQTPSASKDWRPGSEYLVPKTCIYSERPCQAKARCSSCILLPSGQYPLLGPDQLNKQLPPAHLFFSKLGAVWVLLLHQCSVMHGDASTLPTIMRLAFLPVGKSSQDAPSSQKGLSKMWTITEATINLAKLPPVFGSVNCTATSSSKLKRMGPRRHQRRAGECHLCLVS